MGQRREAWQGFAGKRVNKIEQLPPVKKLMSCGSDKLSYYSNAMASKIFFK